MNAEKAKVCNVMSNLSTPCLSHGASFNAVVKLQRIWQSILPVNHLPKPEEDFFFDLSGDSLQAIHLVRKMRDEGWQVSVTDIFQNPSIGKLVPILVRRECGNEDAQIAVEDEATQFLPTPIVQDFFERCPPLKQPDRFSLSALLNFHSKISPEILEKALRSIMVKHSSLRSQFGVANGRVFQKVVPMESTDLNVEMVDMERSEKHLANEPLFVELCKNLEERHSLEHGKLVTAAILNVKDERSHTNQQHFALLVVHHVALDIVSWQQVLEDLASALKRLDEDDRKELVLPKCQGTFQTFCKALHDEAEEVFAKEVEYWTSVEEESRQSGCLVEANLQSSFQSAKWLSDSIDATSIRLTSSKLGCSDEDMLLTAFGRAMAAIHGHDKTSICLERHGRQLTSVDSTDTVGWCTSRFPVVLNTPLSGVLVDEVKEVGQTIKKIPNHGLGFGLLKSKRALTMALPKIMFVYQGSLDASSKETFDGGRFSFDHIPWIEVMLNELKQGRFHRHPNEYLEFDLEIIAWIHGGELKFGCLFDESVICGKVVEEIIKQARLNIRAIVKNAKTKRKKISLEIIPAFNITPECMKSMRDALSHHATIPTEIRVQSAEQMLQFLCTSSTSTSKTQFIADVTVLIPRPRNADQAEELVKACSQSNQRKTSGRSIVMVNTEDLPNTFKIPAPLLSEDQISLEVNLRHISCFYDYRSDTEYNMPLTQRGYGYLGAIIARGIRACVWDSKYKVLAVDADYTLWDGECAQGSVRFNQGNFALHEFLLKKKDEGMVLVILSKNNQADVESVFNGHANEMKLKKNDFACIMANWESKSRNIRYVANIFNLGIDSFVFVDDNPVECEEMIKRCPEVLTLQLPSSMDLVAPLLENLWALDRVHLSAEASKRTELYRSELERKADLHGVEGSTKEAVLSLNKLLFNWEMELEICKTTLGDLGVVKELYTRATELLQRTNQFKINDLKLDLAETRHDDKIWLVSLRDKHGAYGVVSVLLLDKTPEGFFVVQWVLSCRALGRGVEARIFSEVHKEAGTFEEGMSVKVAINKTLRNRPALDFLKTVGIETSTVSSTDLTIVRSDSSSSTSCSEMLHNVKVVSNLTKFLENMNGKSETATRKSNTRSVKNFDHQLTSKDSSTLSVTTHESSKELISLSKNPKSQTRTTSLMRLNEWIEKNWTQSEKQQALFHAMFPVVNVATGTASERTERDDDDDESPERERVLRLSWMEVLNTTNDPQDSDKFIQSGGNSFSAVYLVSILRRKCGIELPIVDVLQNHTYSELKSIINKACLLKEEPALDLIGPEPKCQLPLSSAQQRMVLMQQTAPGSAAYVETIAYQARKLIDPNGIISALVEQHTIFKLKITTSNENLEYSITIDDGMKIEITTEVADDLEGMEIYLKKTTPVIPVIDSNLVNVRYLTAKEYNVLALHIHHVIVDDVTLSNIASDLEKLVHDGAPNQNTSNPSQTYANYVEQEMTYLRTTKCVDDEEFWKKSFTSLPPESNLAILPKAKSTNFETTTYNAKHLNLALSTEAAGGIETYCRMVGITEFQYFLSCAVLVLQRYLGIEEVTLAIPVTTRTDEHEKTDGLFVNTILCRISVNHTLTVKEHIECVAAQWLEALRHFRYPLDQVAKQLWKMHGKNSSSFCSVMFNYAVNDRNANQLSVCARDARMPLSLDVINDRRVRANQTKIVAEWADRLIDDGVVERLTDSVAHLCSTAYREHFKCIKEVSVLSPKELNLLQSFSTTSSNTHGIETCLTVQSSFENTVKTRPHLTAVVINDRCLSYGELNEFALKIANALNNQIEQGHLRSRPVVIVAKKTEYVIAAILGIWKAGGHFLPVAESNQSSLKDIIGRYKPAAILTNLPTYSFVNVVGGERCSVFSIENLIENTSPLGNKEIRSKMTTEDLAYIIQTSGSSGTPKQCKITHKSLSIIANAWTNLYAMREFNVSVLQWEPLSFDVFVGDVVRALLCTPGQLVICPDERRLDIHYILQLIKNHQITMAEVTPMFGQQLSENAIQDEFNSMNVLILGSDVLQPHVYHTVKRKLKKSQRLLNSYGMTEATIDSSFFEGDTLPATRSDTVPIGKPLPGVCFHILDPNTFLPCPVGTVGELYTSGEVLASGDIELLDDSHLGR